MTVKYMEEMVRKAMDDMDLVHRKNNVTVTFNSYDRTLRVSRFGTTVLVLDFDYYKIHEAGVVMWLVTSKTDADALNTVFSTLRAIGYKTPMVKFGYKPKNGGGYAMLPDRSIFK